VFLFGKHFWIFWERAGTGELMNELVGYCKTTPKHKRPSELQIWGLVTLLALSKLFSLISFENVMGLRKDGERD